MFKSSTPLKFQLKTATSVLFTSSVQHLQFNELSEDFKKDKMDERKGGGGGEEQPIKLSEVT